MKIIINLRFSVSRSIFFCQKEFLSIIIKNVNVIDLFPNSSGSNFSSYKFKFLELIKEDPNK